MSHLSKIINSYTTKGPTNDDSDSKTATLFGHKSGRSIQNVSSNSGDSSQRTYFNMTFSGLSVKQK